MIHVEYHKDNTTQSDFEGGAVDLKSTDPKDCFKLGQIQQRMLTDKKVCVMGDWGQGILIRFPLTR